MNKSRKETTERFDDTNKLYGDVYRAENYKQIIIIFVVSKWLA